MKKKLLAIISLFTLLCLLLTGCSKKETAEETTAAADNTVEQTVDSPFELDMKTYESIISSLPDGSYYAFADMDKDHDALLVTDEVFRDEDGNIYASEATVFGFLKDQTIAPYGSVVGGGTAYPLSTKDSMLYFGGRDYINKVTIREEVSGLQVIERALSPEDPAFDRLFAEFDEATPVTFTAVEGSSIPGLKSYEGTWSDSSAGKYLLALEPTDEKSWYDLTITQDNKEKKEIFQAKAHYQDDGSLYYENGRHATRTYAKDGSYKDDVKSNSASGLLTYSIAEKTLTWTDYEAPTANATHTFTPAEGLSFADLKEQVKTTTTKKTTTTTKKTQTTTGKTTTKASTTKKAEPSQNPVMNFVGRYASGRCTIEVSCVGQSGAKFHVYWSNNAAEHSEWIMSGTFNEKNETVRYTNCIKKTVVFNEDGTVQMESIDYTNGSGTMGFWGNSLVWNDDEENVADDMEFEFVG